MLIVNTGRASRHASDVTFLIYDCPLIPIMKETVSHKSPQVMYVRAEFSHRETYV